MHHYVIYVKSRVVLLLLPLVVTARVVFSQVPETLAKNMALLDLIRAWALRKEANGVPSTLAQISLAWLLAQRPFIVPIPGTTKLHHLEEDLGATAIKFTPEELEEFRRDFSEIDLIGVRSPESALVNQ